MGDSVHLVPSRHNFPVMYIPVVYEHYAGDGKLVMAGGDEFDIGTHFNNINPIIINSKKIYFGPSTCFTEQIPYNHIVGLDNIDLFLTTDTYADFNLKFSENGFIESSACVGTMEKIEDKKYEISPTISVFDGNEIFEMGNYLYKKYPLRAGSTVVLHACILNNINCAACLIGVPRKRDQKPAMATFTTADSIESLDQAVIEKVIEMDPKKNKFLRIYVAKFNPKQKNSNICIGFFEVAAHLTIFQHDAKVRLHGISVRED